MCPIVGIIKHETQTRQKYLERLEPKIFLYTDLRTEAHPTSLHDTVVCKFRSMSRDVPLQPRHGTGLLPEHLAADPPAGILDGVP